MEKVIIPGEINRDDKTRLFDLMIQGEMVVPNINIEQQYGFARAVSLPVWK